MNNPLRVGYRIRPVWFRGWEPQMRYTAGWSGAHFWTPLNLAGYWAEPGSFDSGKRSEKRYPLSLADARRAVERAKRINGAGLLEAA